MTFTAEIKGRLSEDWYRSEDSFNESYINAIEKAIEKDIHQRVSRLLHRLQDDLKTDVTKLAEYARDQLSEGMAKR